MLLVTGDLMVTVDEAIIARYEKEGKHFEMLVDPDLAYDLKEGRAVSLSKMLASNIIFSDARKAVKASEHDVEKIFGTHDAEKIAEQLVKRGEIQLTTEFRRRKTEEKRKQIAAFISRHAINPQTRLPHPQERVLNAMDLAKVNIDPFKPTEQQVDEVIKALKSIIPISVEELKLQVEVSAKHASRVLGIIKNNIREQRWLADGSLSVKVSIPAGLRDEIYHKINAVTEGGAKIIEIK